MTDLISRQAAIEVIEAGRLTKLIEAEVAINGLRALPSAQRWIPCSERLPKEEEQSYWVCMEDGYQKQCRWKRYEGKDCYIYAWHSTLKVIAWMPLPAPYRREGDEKQEG